ncbi:MAG: hypothetical protein Q4D48_06965 [Coriobacteriales bacterium]|nr:hypothetical protein [Coriobacteriales bacterium]
MDIQSAATQLLNYLGNNPEKLAQLAAHPYSTTAKATGTNERISQKDMSRVLAQVAAQVSGQSLGTNETKDLASTLLGQNGGSVHTLANTLFGGASTPTASGSAGPSMTEIMAKSVAGGLAARGMAALLTTALGAAKKKE